MTGAHTWAPLREQGHSPRSQLAVIRPESLRFTRAPPKDVTSFLGAIGCNALDYPKIMAKALKLVDARFRVIPSL
jgi:hypothetical protein